MFGQKSPFGTSTTSAFGNTATGTSLFSQQSKPVGVSFGTQLPTQNTGGLFGSALPSTGGLFGASSSTAAPTSSLFGGASTTASTGGLFGASSQQQKPLFGATSTGGFGGSSLFGSPQTAKPAPATGMFGQPSGSLFSSSATTQSGTTVKFDPPIAQDTMMKNNQQQTINTKHLCITAMKQYENKSMEELRCEDYIANRKGPQQGGSLTFGQPAAQQQPGGLFGGGGAAANTGGSLFGQTANKPLFGAPTSTFGTSTAAGGGLFGTATTTTQPGSLFGAKPVGSNLFGTTATTSAAPAFGTTQSGGLFGAKPATTGLFGTTAQPQTSLFGTSTTFGQPAASTGAFSFNAQPSAPGTTGPFGATSTAPTGFGGFGTSTGGGLFGNKTTTTTAAPAFGGFGTQPAGFGTTGGFGQPQPQPQTGGLFGAAQKPGGLFGSPATSVAQGGLFGSAQPTQTTGLFGGASKPGQFSMFGSPATSTAGTFGATNNLNFGGNTMGSFAPQQQPQQITLGTDPGYAAAQQVRLQEQIASSPYGDSPLLKLLSKKPSEIGASVPTDPAAQNKIIHGSMSSTYGASSGRAPVSFGSNIKSSPMPRISARIVSPLASRSGSFMNKSTNNSILDDLDDDVALLKEGFVPRKNVKKLLITPKTTRHSVATSVAQPMSESSTRRRTAAVLADHNAITSPVDSIRDADMRWGADPPELNLDATGNSSTRLDTSNIRAPRPVRASLVDTPKNDTSMAEASMLVSPSREEADERVPARTEPPPPPHPAGISLMRSDYYTIPSMADLADMTGRDGSCVVADGFTVGRLGYGSVFWPGEADVSNLDLDELVHFRHKEVTVYADETKKPPIGQELNRRAEVTLERVWPTDKTTRQPIKDADRLHMMQFRDRLERAAGQMGAVFKDYRPDSGSWVFEVSHFSKYGLLDEDDAEGPTKPELTRSQLEQQTQAAVQRAPWEITPPGKTKPLGPNNSLLSTVPAAKKYDNMGLGGFDSIEEDMMAEQPPLDLAEGVEMEMTGDLVDVERVMSSTHKAIKLMMEQSLFDSHYEDSLKGKEKFQSSDLRPSKYKKLDMLRDVFDRSELLMDQSEYQFRDGATNRFLDDQSLRAEAAMAGAAVSLPPAIAPEHCLALVPLNESVLAYREGSLIDLGLFNGRRFRVGWAPNRINLSVDSTESAEKLRTATQVQLNVLGAEQSEQQASSYVDMFEHNVRLSTVEAREGFCPKVILPAEGVELLHAFEATASQCYRSGHEEVAVWRLAVALWGALADSSLLEGSYCFEMVRKNAVSDWLIGVSKQSLDRDLKTVKGPAAVLALLRSGRVDDAVDRAMTQGDCRLALLLASASACTEARALCLDQLVQWRRTAADSFIDADRLKTLALLAGQTHWSCVDERGKSQTLNCCADLDWRRAFGLYVWYVGAETDGLLEAMALFDTDVVNGISPPPTRRSSTKTDLCYHLIKLFVDRSHSLEAVLNPDAFADDPFDYHLSWHLWSALKAIGYSHLPPAKEDVLHTRYAEQLAACGLWHLGVFVLMHIANDGRRTEAVKEFLSRFAFNCSDEQYDALVSTFSIPTTWLADARYLKAKADGRKDEEAWAAVEAEKWNLAHQLFLQHVGPNAVTSENYDILERFVRRLSAHSSEVLAWPMGGQIYEDFLTLKKELYRLVQLDDAASDVAVADLKQVLASLASRLDAMCCDQPIQRLCQGEMSKTVVHLSRVVLTVDEQLQLEPLLLRLPMPDDYAVDEDRRSARYLLTYFP